MLMVVEGYIPLRLNRGSPIVGLIGERSLEVRVDGLPQRYRERSEKGSLMDLNEGNRAEAQSRA
jgi:hypothetical protein